MFLLGWGTDKLTYRAEDLDHIRRWTAQDADWADMLRIHHALRPKPTGKPTFRLVTQMTGHHGYRRTDAGKAVSKGLAGKLPASWRLRRRERRRGNLADDQRGDGCVRPAAVRSEHAASQI